MTEFTDEKVSFSLLSKAEHLQGSGCYGNAQVVVE